MMKHVIFQSPRWVVWVMLWLLAASAHATLFASAGQNLADELQQAKAEKRALVVYFELPNCVGCLDMQRHVFPDPRVEREFGRQFRAVRIDLASTSVLFDEAGKATSAKQLAQRWGVTGTPAFAFLDQDGALSYRHSGLIAKAADFVRLGQFVLAAAYDEQPFGEYLRRSGGALHAASSPLARVKTGQAPLDFALRDQHGKLRHLADFRGKAVALAVGYTQCPDVCPTTLSEMLQVVTGLGADAKQLQVLFVTLDPERDKPEMLRSYMAAFHPDFLALRGNAAQTRAFIKRFELVTIKRPLTGYKGYTLDHTAGVFLFDRGGQLRGFSPYGQPLDLLAADVKTLALEVASAGIQVSQRQLHP
ncbi:MAG: SCO family protein [Sideroxydans sp.]|nr:SCO family protein [Sideroxydans sp.]